MQPTDNTLLGSFQCSINVQNGSQLHVITVAACGRNEVSYQLRPNAARPVMGELSWVLGQLLRHFPLMTTRWPHHVEQAIKGLYASCMNEVLDGNFAGAEWWVQAGACSSDGIALSRRFMIMIITFTRILVLHNLNHLISTCTVG